MRLTANRGLVQIAELVNDADRVLGVFLLGHDHVETRLSALFAVAKRYNLILDFHVDEDLDPSLDNVEAIVDAKVKSEFDGVVLCGHACALSAKPHSEQLRLAQRWPMPKCMSSLCQVQTSTCKVGSLMQRVRAD